MRGLSSIIDLHAKVNRNEDLFSVDAINDWLAGTLPANHPLSQELHDSPYNDPWGNPYRCVSRNDNADNKLGVYSLGRDGTSDSLGNDHDDLNSWNEDCYRWYVRDINQRKRIDYAMQGAMIAPFVYVGMLGVGWVVGSIRRSKNGA